VFPLACDGDAAATGRVPDHNRDVGGSIMAEPETTPEHPREITLELIFRQGQQILDDTRTVREEQRGQRARLSAIEHTLAQEFGHSRMEFARLERIERRLDLVEDTAVASKGIVLAGCGKTQCL
jgi:hypothetical protein